MSVVECPTLAQLADIAGGRIDSIVDVAGVTVQAIGINAQELPQGGVFAAVPGSNAHGARFAGQADASAVLTDAQGLSIVRDELGLNVPVIVVDQVREVLGAVSSAVYGHPSQSLRIIGITGTSGKTTTSYLMEKALMARGKKVGLIGTTGTRIDGRAVPTKLTTPEAPKLQELFASMRDQGVTDVVMEVSSHAISLGRVAGTRFVVKAFNNLSQDHLDFHHSMEEYFEAKAAWFMPDDQCTFIVNVDDPWGRTLADRTGALTLSLHDAAGVEVSQRVTAGDNSQSFVWRREGSEPVKVSIPLPGEFNVANAAMALACVSVVDPDGVAVAAEALGQVAVPGRMQRVDVGQDFLAVVDYAHKPAAIAAILKELSSQVKGRIGVVVGAGGDRDQAKRPLMGREAARCADLVVVTDDNPRSEDPAMIRAAVLEGTQGTNAEVVEIGDRAQAIAQAVAWAQPGDAIVVAGKGHETGQIIGGVTHHFDDREQLEAAIVARLDEERQR